MPELPEVEVVRAGLAAEVAGRRVESVVISGARTVRRQHPEALAQSVTGAVLGTAGRTGKFLHVPLSDAGPGDGADVLVVHLRMSGQLWLCRPDDPVAPHTHAVLRLSGGRELRFVDHRTFGELFTCTADEATGVPVALAHLGPDALDPTWSAARLRAALVGRRAPVKTVLMDQRRLAGLGNIYSDEALFTSGLRFDRPGGLLRPVEVRRLHGAIVSTLAEAVECRGSSLADATYVDLMGRAGAYQSRHRVYGREGAACARCARGVVVRQRFGGRSTFFCPRCQR